MLLLSKDSQVRIATILHIHTYTHTHTYIYAYTDIHIHTHTYIYIYRILIISLSKMTGELPGAQKASWLRPALHERIMRCMLGPLVNAGNSDETLHPKRTCSMLKQMTKQMTNDIEIWKSRDCRGEYEP